MSNLVEYNPLEIEPRWQSQWEESGAHTSTKQTGRSKFYLLNFFPYPSGEGLHVGHCRNYIPTDVLARFKRMKGFNVLFPMGWDSFGEPTEQHAIAHGIHPRQTTDENTANFRKQLTQIGTSFDWTREIDSSRPGFYRWTQWIFLLLYRRGLAYRDTNWQWWCPTCQTTLSSHEITNGVCWRGHSGVTKREIPAWYFRITAYADQLLDGLDEIDWPDRIKTMQRNWIGRSEGTEIDFRTEAGEVISTFTTRPDTLFGVTFLALAPEHPLVARLTSPDRRQEVEAYTDLAVQRSEIERAAENRPGTGVFTGGHVINPVNQERVPVWISDYVLPGYGTGAVMGVPAHDARDYEFARQHHLPVRMVVAPPGYDGEALTEAYIGPGTQVGSGSFDGLPNHVAGRGIQQHLVEQNLGRNKIQYKMRDWLISRQRYWGTPIPIVYCDGCGEVPVPEEDLPVCLPPVEDFTPDGTGKSPLARVREFTHTRCPTCEGPATRETDTMGGFACSSWYFLRFTNPEYDRGAFEPEAMRYWMPVDLYVGGVEHATLHLLYARFWTRVMADAGLIPFKEPFARLLNQGILHAPDGHRMSKSRGNVITPESVITSHGADSLRVYSLFMAPFDQDVNWNTDGINGAWRFLLKVWGLYPQAYNDSATETREDPELERKLHITIRRTTERMEGLRFNTMVSNLMEFVNDLTHRWADGTWRTRTFHQALETLPLLLAPIAPHIAEEIWVRTGHRGSIHGKTWPEWDPRLAQELAVDVAVQVNGKLREVISMPPDTPREVALKTALEAENVQQHLEGKEIARLIYVPGQVINLVT